MLEFFLWLVLTLALLDQVVRPLQTLTNVVGALREEDYSFRARGAAPNDALGELALEINALADILTEQRMQTIEATALLRRVVEEIDTPLFTFDPDHVLRLMNAAGERLLQQPAARLLGKTATELELNACFEARNETLVALPYSAPNARWMVRKRSFRQNGVPHTLIVLSDVSRALREEERSAWQSLIRVLGHELNNSLAPIISISGSLSSRLPLPELPDAQNADFQRGLNIIESRTASLHRFLQSYRRLAQMPSPTLQPVELRPLIERVAALETRLQVDIVPGPDLVLMIDPDLIEQMLINLVRNAVDAALEQAQSPQAGRTVAILRSACGGSRPIIKSLSWSRTTASACSIPAMLLCRSIPPSREARASAWCYPSRSPKRTAAPSSWPIARRARLPREGDPALSPIVANYDPGSGLCFAPARCAAPVVCGLPPSLAAPDTAQ